MTLNPQAYKPNPIQGLWSCHDTHVMLALIRTSVFRACACICRSPLGGWTSLGGFDLWFASGLRFQVSGLGCRVWGLGLRVWGLRLSDQGLGSRR